MRLSGYSLALLLILLLLPSGASADGILEVRIKDHREAIDDFSKLILTFDKIGLSPKPGLKFWQTGWKYLNPVVGSVDLTRYTSKTSAEIFRGSLADGAFDGIDVKVKAITGVLKKGGASAKVKNSVAAIRLPFTINSGRSTLIILDFVVLDMSDHPPQGYELGIKGWELFSDGKLVDKIPPG